MGYFQALLESEIRTDPNFLAKGNGDLIWLCCNDEVAQIYRPPRGVLLLMMKWQSVLLKQ